MFDNLVTETYLQILFLFFINKQVWSSLLEFRLQDTTFEFDYPYCFVVAEFKGLYLTQALCWDSASETISLIATRIVVMNPWSNALETSFQRTCRIDQIREIVENGNTSKGWLILRREWKKQIKGKR